MIVTDRHQTHSDPELDTGQAKPDDSSLDAIVGDPRFSAFPPEIQERLKRLSPEAAAAVMASGLIFWIVPGPGTPLILAGGMRLWPQLFEKIAGRVQQHFPGGHRAGLEVLRRFLDDLDSRFPQETAG